MRAHTCPECEFVYLGDDLPDEGCPECGVVWSPVVVSTPKLSQHADLDDQPERKPVSASEGPPPSFVGPVLSGVLIGALLIAIPVYALRHRLFPPEDSTAYRELQNRAEGMVTTRDMAQNRLRASAEQLMETQQQRDEWKQKYEVAETARQRFESQMEQAAVAIAAMRRNSGDSYLRHWQVLGPFPWENDRSPVRVEFEPIDLTREYTGVSGPVAWTPVESKDPRLNVAEILDHSGRSVCYAICWVESERDREVLLSLGSDDGMAVWINRIKYHEFTGNRAASAGQDEVPARFKKGWNEVLIRIDNKGGGDWALYFECKDLKRKKPLKVFATYVPQVSESSHSE